ncbi:MAG: HlyD family efflux transporter periplasmic adaptor subunit [Eubacterium sp.]|nr:HlyD family efflux transporter periplasmic adaptor subunit [Eubacterium sp.]
MDKDVENTSKVETQETSEPKLSWEEKYGKKGKNGKKKKAKPGVVIAIVAAVLIVLGLVVVWGYRTYTNAMQSVQEAMGDGTVVEAYGPQDMTAYIDVNGVVESDNVETVTTELTYAVKEIKVEVGDHVKKGDVVAVIDSEGIERQIEDLEAQASDAERIKAKELETARHSLNNASNAQSQTMDAANKSISEAKKAFEDADTDYYDKLDAYNDAWNTVAEYATSTDAIESNPAVSSAKASLDAAEEMWYVKQYAYDQATSNYSDTATSASSTYQSAKDSYDMTQISNTSSYSATASQLADLYEKKGDTVIIAQSSGIVTSINAVVGLPVTGSIMTIQDDENLVINVGIKEKDIFSVKEGMTVEFSNNQLENVTGKGLVTKVNTFAVPDTSSVSAVKSVNTAALDNTFNAKLSITEKNDILIGMKLKGRISTGEESRVNAVPYTAILADEDGEYVYVAEEVQNGMYSVVRKSVEKGMSGDYYVEITGGDLVEGDKVICYPNTVMEGGIVTITE